MTSTEMKKLEKKSVAVFKRIVESIKPGEYCKTPPFYLSANSHRNPYPYEVTDWSGKVIYKVWCSWKTINNWGYGVHHVNFRDHQGDYWYGRLTGESKQVLDFARKLKRHPITGLKL